MKKYIRGFTLIELMIVLTIVALIIAFGYPSYRSRIMKAQRADAKIFMLDIANRQERFYADRGSYTTTITDLGLANTTSPDGHYTVAITAEPSNDIMVTYRITATPQGNQTNDSCRSFSLDSLGNKSASPGRCRD